MSDDEFWPSHEEVMEKQEIKTWEDLQQGQLSKLQKNGTFHKAFEAHKKMTELKARKTIFENTKRYHQAFVDSRNAQNKKKI